MDRDNRELINKYISIISEELEELRMIRNINNNVYIDKKIDIKTRIKELLRELIK